MSSLYDLFIFGRLLVNEKLDQLTLDSHRPYCPSISDFLPDMDVSSAQNLSFQTPQKHRNPFYPKVAEYIASSAALWYIDVACNVVAQRKIPFCLKYLNQMQVRDCLRWQRYLLLALCQQCEECNVKFSDYNLAVYFQQLYRINNTRISHLFRSLHGWHSDPVLLTSIF